jgi:hypothetical protein
MPTTSRPQHVYLLILLLGWAGGAAGPSAAASQDAVVLLTTFADGRTTHSVVTADPRSSRTPMFPRLPGWRPPADELAISALKFTRTLEDGGKVRVGVAVLRGIAWEREDAVATVIVAPGQVVTIEALREIGVAPVILSTTALADTRLHPPQVVNKTAGLEVTDVELVMTPRPRYRIAVTNVSAQPAVNFHVVAHQGGRRSLSGNRGNADASPIIPPGGTYWFELDPSSSPPATVAGWAPVPHDAVEIAAALWEDGSIEGDAASMAVALSIYRGRQVQLSRGLAVLEAVRNVGQASGAKARLKEHIERLPIEPDEATLSRAQERLQNVENLEPAAIVAALRVAMADTRKGMLDDLADAPDDGEGFQQWLAKITALYVQWRDRFATR